MTDREKMIAYEVHIENMLQFFQENLKEFDEMENMDDFEEGRRMAYIEVIETIKLRHEIIWSVLEDDEETN